MEIKNQLEEIDKSLFEMNQHIINFINIYAEINNKPLKKYSEDGYAFLK